MIGLTPRQRELLAYLQGRDLCPSIYEIKNTLRASTTSVEHWLQGLEERGHIRRLRNRHRAIEVLKPLPIQPIIINGQRYRFIHLERVEG